MGTATASTSAGTQELAAQPTEYETNVSGSQSQTEEERTGESIETYCTEMATTFTVDWGQYTPAMLRENKNPLLMPPPSPSPDVQNQPSVSNFDTQECRATVTPPRLILISSMFCSNIHICDRNSSLSVMLCLLHFHSYILWYWSYKKTD